MSFPEFSVHDAARIVVKRRHHCGELSFSVTILSILDAEGGVIAEVLAFGPPEGIGIDLGGHETPEIVPVPETHRPANTEESDG